MKKINFVLAMIIMFSSSVVFAQKVMVNTDKSGVEWHAKKIGTNHTGNIMVKSGHFELKDGNISAGTIIMDMTSITNTDLENAGYNQKLVGHLKSDDFFGVAKFPTAKFVVAKSTVFTNSKASLTGDITIKGKSETITFDVLKSENGYMATIKVDRSNFDVRYGSDSFFDNLGDKAIDDIFELHIKLVTN